MSSEIGQANPPFSPPSNWRANPLATPVTPGRRLPVVDKSKVDPKIREAAEGMEAMFLDYMMKVMRQTVPKNELNPESPATGIYRGMLDSEYAQKAARAGGVGLADQIIAYLAAERYTLPKDGETPSAAPHGFGVAPPARPTGGSHEGQSVE